MKRPRSRILLVVPLLALTLTARSQTNTLVIPKEAETKFGSSWSYAFALANSYSERIYASSEFAALPTDVIMITEVAFRLDEAYPEEDETGRMRIDMNAFPGSMEQIVQQLTGVQNPIPVFQQEMFRFVARGGLVEAFDFRFHLQTPFAYDRRIGPLVLSIYAGSSEKVALDGQSGPIFGGVPQQAMSIVIETGGHRRLAVPPVTQFSYLPSKWARINSIRTEGITLEITFSIGGDSSVIRLEAAPSVEGPYKIEQEMESSGIADGNGAFRVPISSNIRFFRLRLD